MSKDAHDDLKKWKEEEEKKEKEFKKRLEEEERRKKEELESMKRKALEEHQKNEAEFKKQQEANKPPEPTPEPVGNWCTGCKNPFKDVIDIYVVGGKKYCKPCSNNALTASRPGAPKCAHCGLPLELTVAKAGGRKYHPECLKCSQCGGSLNKGFRQTGRTFTCFDCTGGFGLGGGK